MYIYLLLIIYWTLVFQAIHSTRTPCGIVSKWYILLISFIMKPLITEIFKIFKNALNFPHIFFPLFWTPVLAGLGEPVNLVGQTHKYTSELGESVINKNTSTLRDASISWKWKRRFPLCHVLAGVPTPQRMNWGLVLCVVYFYYGIVL